MILNPLVPLFGRLVARGGRKRGNRQTDGQTDRRTDGRTYRPSTGNPRCPCAPRVTVCCGFTVRCTAHAHACAIKSTSQAAGYGSTLYIGIAMVFVFSPYH